MAITIVSKKPFLGIRSHSPGRSSPSLVVIRIVVVVRLDGYRDVRISGERALLVVGGILSGLGGDTAASLFCRGRSRSTSTRGDPVDCAGVQGDIECAGEQAQDRVFVTLVVDQGEDVAGAQNQGNHGADEGATSDLSELALAGALENGVGAHQGLDEEDGEPARDKDIVEDQDDGGQWLQPDVALVILVQHRDAVQDHED